jgi:hypothetical protein
MNLKNERIKKLWNGGLTDPARIARKLGLASTDRVLQGLQWWQDERALTPSFPLVEVDAKDAPDSGDSRLHD